MSPQAESGGLTSRAEWHDSSRPQRAAEGKTLHVELTVEELETSWNAMEYAYEALDSDMSLDSENRAELRKLEELKDRIKGILEAQQGSQGANERY